MYTDTGNQILSKQAKAEQKIISVLLAASVFCLPFFQDGSVVCWILLFIYVLFHGNYTSFYHRLKQHPFYIGMVLLYLFYLAGMLWTENYLLGWEDLLIKIPLLLFPFLFLTLPIERSSFTLVRKSLIFGCLLAVIYCFVKSFQHFLLNHDFQDFYYTTFSYLMHPTYFTMYINLSILFLMQLMLEDKFISRSAKWMNGFLFFLFVIVAIILTARIAMLTTFFTLIVFTIFEVVQRKKMKLLWPRLAAGAIVILFLFFSLIKVYNRFSQISDVIEKKEDKSALVDTVNHVGYNSTTIRIGLLKNGIAILKDNFWLGVGTGDVIPESVNRLNNSGLHVLAEKSTGAHNQYLQTAVTLGIFAALLLIVTLFIPIFQYFRSDEYFFFSFMLIVLFNGVGDTILRASSLFFFSFFGCYFYAYFNIFNRKSR